MACARMGLDVVLVESNMNQAALRRMLNLENDVEVTPLSSSSVLHLVSVPSDIASGSTLQVLTGDKIEWEPLDLISSPQFQQVLEEVDHMVDLCIIDGPSILSSAEASILANRVDGVLMVARVRRTRLAVLCRPRFVE